MTQSQLCHKAIARRRSSGPLRGAVAVVAGATRGAGRGIAKALGEAGATVYVTGRSAVGNRSHYNRPGTIEATAEMISAAGGSAVPVRVDHTVESEVEALFQRVIREHSESGSTFSAKTTFPDSLTAHHLFREGNRNFAH